jgi:hypothetical protein
VTNGENDWCLAFWRNTGTWYGRLVPGEFKHVGLFRYMVETNTWVYLDYDFKGVHCFSMIGTEEGIVPLAKALNGGDCAIIRMKVTNRELAFRGVATCVSFVKHALGFNRWWVFTPDQLYWRLIEEGAEHIKS